MEGQHIKGLMEAYSLIYSEPELLDEEVEVEEVDMELEDDFEVLDEQGGNRGAFRRRQRIAADRRRQAAGGGAAGEEKEYQRLQSQNVRPSGSAGRRWRPRSEADLRRQAGYNVRQQGDKNLRNNPNYKPPEKTKSSTPTPKTTPTPTPTPTPAPRSSSPAPRPSSAPASKPAAAAPAKPVVKQTGDKAKDMATWAKANPKLAAAKAERDRTRGTSASTNPLMKDMPGKRPAPKSLSKTDAGAKFNPSAPKIDLKSKTPPAKDAGAKFNPSAPKINLKQDLDIFDLVKGHLLDEGYAETEQAAMTIMANMSEEWRQDILEFLGGQKGDGYLGHPNLGIKNPLAKKQPTAKTSSNTGLAGRLGNNAAKTNAAIDAMRGK